MPQGQRQENVKFCPNAVDFEAGWNHGGVDMTDVPLLHYALWGVTLSCAEKEGIDYGNPGHDS